MVSEWTDDEIIGAILAGQSVRPIRFGLSSFGQLDVVRGWTVPTETPVEQTPCCAIGAGILYRGLNIKDRDAIAVFAQQYSVPVSFACGVSDGFENRMYVSSPKVTKDMTESKNYARGWAIGAAVRAAIEEQP